MAEWQAWGADGPVWSGIAISCRCNWSVGYRLLCRINPKLCDNPGPTIAIVECLAKLPNTGSHLQKKVMLDQNVKFDWLKMLHERGALSSWNKPDLSDTIRRLQAFSVASGQVLFAPGLFGVHRATLYWALEERL